MAAARNQPTYDFISGAPASPPRPLRQTLRQSQAVRTDQTNEDLRAQIKTLEYELSTLKQDEEVTTLQYQNELREAQNKADADFRRAQTAEANAKSAISRSESMARELQEIQSQATNEKLELERRVRTASSQRATLQEELEEVQEQLATLERENSRRQGELETINAKLQQSFDQLRADVEIKALALENAQQKLSQRDNEYGQMEGEILKLKSTSGDSGAVELLKRQLSEQVSHIKKLETTNRAQLAELQEFRKTRKSVEMVEEEKRTLETKLRLMDDLRTELAEVQLRNAVLEDEKKSWTSYLESQSSSDEDLAFESPEDLARAFMRQRLENASLVERMGILQPELNVKDHNIRALEDSKVQLQAEIEKLKAAGSSSGDAKTRSRLERQKILAVKEAEYLRAQLKALDAEESEMNPERYSEEQAKRVQELESLVDEHRKEIDTLNADITKAEAQPIQPAAVGMKRALEDASDERLGELLRKNRQLQDSYNSLHTRSAVLENELKAKTTQLDSIKSGSRTRILELRNNPTTAAEAIKKSTLDALKAENETLHAQLQGRLPTSTGSDGSSASDLLVPRAALARLELQLSEKDGEMASLGKSQARLRQIFRAKGLEFIEAVVSLLGWRLNIQPNGKARVSPIFHPKGSADGVGRGGGSGEEEHFIEFDGENGTMKVSGGTQSEFAKEIKGLIEFWVDGKGQVPCFLAAMTLEFYERYGDPKRR